MGRSREFERGQVEERGNGVQHIHLRSRSRTRVLEPDGVVVELVSAQHVHVRKRTGTRERKFVVRVVRANERAVVSIGVVIGIRVLIRSNGHTSINDGTEEYGVCGDLYVQLDHQACERGQYRYVPLHIA